MPVERREFWFRGHVQGVGFRFTARDVAQRFAVSGFVENRADGRVYLVVEGEPQEIRRFVSALTSEMERYVRGVDEQVSVATGEFSSFAIRR